MRENMESLKNSTAVFKNFGLGHQLFDPDAKIPKIIHQTWSSRHLPEILVENMLRIKEMNPDWDHRFYDDTDIQNFIFEKYGGTLHALYNKINPKYGPARADFFRYLLMY